MKPFALLAFSLFALSSAAQAGLSQAERRMNAAVEQES